MPGLIRTVLRAGRMCSPAVRPCARLDGWLGEWVGGWRCVSAQGMEDRKSTDVRSRQTLRDLVPVDARTRQARRLLCALAQDWVRSVSALRPHAPAGTPLSTLSTQSSSPEWLSAAPLAAPPACSAGMLWTVGQALWACLASAASLAPLKLSRVHAKSELVLE